MAEEADSLRATYIRRLTSVLIQHVPAFWRLALSVFSGKFAKVRTLTVALQFTRKM
jgi:exocyst complex component 2